MALAIAMVGQGLAEGDEVALHNGLRHAGGPGDGSNELVRLPVKVRLLLEKMCIPLGGKHEGAA